MKETTYYRQYESRRVTLWKLLVFQFLAVIFMCVGISYLSWRWMYSLNPDALWFSVPLAAGETFMFLGSVMMIFSYWKPKTLTVQPPVTKLSEIEPLQQEEKDRPVTIDVFITTYNEEKDIVEDTVRDAVKLNYDEPAVSINPNLSIRSLNIT